MSAPTSPQLFPSGSPKLAPSANPAKLPPASPLLSLPIGHGNAFSRQVSNDDPPDVIYDRTRQEVDFVMRQAMRSFEKTMADTVDAVAAACTRTCLQCLRAQKEDLLREMSVEASPVVGWKTPGPAVTAATAKLDKLASERARSHSIDDDDFDDERKRVKVSPRLEQSPSFSFTSAQVIAANSVVTPLVATSGKWTPLKTTSRPVSVPSFGLPKEEVDKEASHDEEIVWVTALESEHPDLAAFLQQKGLPHLNAKSAGADGFSTAWNALHHAVLVRRPDIVRMLGELPQFRGMNDLTSNRTCALLGAISYNIEDVALELLNCKRYTAVNTENDKKLTPLMFAVQLGNVRITTKLLADPRIEMGVHTPVGGTIIHVAVSQGHVAMTKLLLNKAGNLVNSCNAIGQTPLHVCVNKEVAVELLNCSDLRVDVMQARDASGRNALHCAVLHNLPEVVKALLEKEAIKGVDKGDRKGWTALHMAAFRGQIHVVQALLFTDAGTHSGRAYQVNMGRVDANGKTACDLARQKGHEAVVQAFDRAAKVPTTPKVIAAIPTNDKLSSALQAIERATSGQGQERPRDDRLIDDALLDNLGDPAGPSLETSTSLAPSGDKAFKVIGGVESGGIIVRESALSTSAARAERLAVGAIIKELKAAGNRMNYQLITGSGPETGWVSYALNGKPLLEPFKG